MMAPAAISALRPSGRPAARGPAARPHARRTSVAPRAGFLDFMIPKPGGGGGAAARRPARSAELVEQLLGLSAGTDAGIKASPSRRAEIEGVVSELAAFCMRSPLRSDLIFGEWEVVYASKPQTAGGPFRSPLGRAVFPGQRAVQVIAEPNRCVNEVTYKTLGFVPGAARQEGEIEPVNETTFQLNFPGLDAGRRGAGGPPRRLIEVVYLDERVRVARALPQEEGEEGSFYVFARVGGEEEEEAPAPAPRADKRAPPPPPAPKRRQARTAVAEEEEEEEEEEKPARRGPAFPAFNLFPARSPAEGRATMAERAVARAGTGSTRGTQRLAAKQQTQAGTQRRGGTGATRTAAAAGTATTRKSREEVAAERAAAATEAKARAEEQRRARAEAAAEARAAAEEERAARAEAAAAARAAAEEERRAKAEAVAAARVAAEEERRQAREAAEAERAAAAQRQTAAKEAYAALAGAATEASAEARETATAYKAAEKEATALLRAAGQARGIIERAVAAAEEAAAEQQAAAAEEVAAEKDVLEGQRLVNALEKRLREVSAAVAPRIKK